MIFRQQPKFRSNHHFGSRLVFARDGNHEVRIWVAGCSTGEEAYTVAMLLCEGMGEEEFRNRAKVYATDADHLALTDDEILTLARWAVAVEEHYGGPVDMEWAKDGESGEMFIVQARPETVQSRKEKAVLRTWRLKAAGKRLVSGHSVGDAIGTGKARLVLAAEHMNEFQKGEILVTDKTDPDWEPIMKKASAIVTNQGGRTCHAAIVGRERHLPTAVATPKPTRALRDGAVGGKDARRAARCNELGCEGEDWGTGNDLARTLGIPPT